MEGVEASIRHQIHAQSITSLTSLLSSLLLNSIVSGNTGGAFGVVAATGQLYVARTDTLDAPTQVQNWCSPATKQTHRHMCAASC